MHIGAHYEEFFALLALGGAAVAHGELEAVSAELEGGIVPRLGEVLVYYGVIAAAHEGKVVAGIAGGEHKVAGSTVSTQNVYGSLYAYAAVAVNALHCAGDERLLYIAVMHAVYEGDVIVGGRVAGDVKLSVAIANDGIAHVYAAFVKAEEPQFVGAFLAVYIEFYGHIVVLILNHGEFDGIGLAVGGEGVLAVKLYVLPLVYTQLVFVYGCCYAVLELAGSIALFKGEYHSAQALAAA